MFDPYFTSKYKVQYHQQHKRPYRRGIKFNWKKIARCKPVICIETGERFESAAAAGRHLKLGDGRQIVNAIIRKGKVRGLTFQYENSCH